MSKAQQDKTIHKYERLLIENYNSDIMNFAENKSNTVINLFSLSNTSVQVGSAFFGNEVVYILAQQ